MDPVPPLQKPHPSDSSACSGTGTTLLVAGLEVVIPIKIPIEPLCIFRKMLVKERFPLDDRTDVISVVELGKIFQSVTKGQIAFPRAAEAAAKTCVAKTSRGMLAF